MTTPVARVLTVLEVLQSGGTWTAHRLADRLGVDERTARRYVTQLEDLGVPVRSLRGRYGGYRLEPGFRLPPLMFTDDEAVAVVVALVAARHTTPVTGPGASSDSVLAKLRRVLPAQLAQRVTALLATTEFTDSGRAVAAERGLEGAAVQSLLLLAEAAAARHPVAVTYVDRHDRRSDRVLHPYGLVVHHGRWYVVAADTADGQTRNFRFDRMNAATPRQGSFDVPAGLDTVRHVVDGLADAPRRHAVSVLVEAPPEFARARISPGLARVEPARPVGWVRVVVHAERLDWIPPLLAGLDRPFVVEEPAALRDLVDAFALRLQHHARQTPDSAPDEYPGPEPTPG